MTPLAKPFARSRASFALLAVAVTATRLLCATGSAFMRCWIRFGPSARWSCAFTRRATARLTTSRAAVSTSRVGSLDWWISGSPASVVSLWETGVTRMSDSAVYSFWAVTT